MALVVADGEFFRLDRAAGLLMVPHLAAWCLPRYPVRRSVG
jgi:hypothetical protein